MIVASTASLVSGLRCGSFQHNHVPIGVVDEGMVGLDASMDVMLKQERDMVVMI